MSNDVDEAIPAGFQRVEEYRDNRPRRLRDSISWKGKALIAAFVVLFALAVTCPDEDAHRRVVAREVESVCGSNGIYDMFDRGSIFSDVISMFMDNVVDVVASTVEVKDCMFFSIGYLDGHPVSFGILHHVFLFADGNDFKQYLKEKSMITR